NRDPLPPSRINPEIPPELERILSRLLEKDRDLRYQHASDVRAELKRLKRDTGSGRGTAVSAVSSAEHGQARPERSERDARATLPAMATGETPVPQDTPTAGHGSSDSQVIAALVKRHKKTFLGGLAAVVAAALALIYWLMPPLPPPTVSGFVQLTHDAAGKRLFGTDGSRLYLGERGLGAGQMSVNGGDVVPIGGRAIAPGEFVAIASVSPDGSRLLLLQMKGFYRASSPLWTVPTLGGGRIRLADIEGNGGAWSPDGRNLVYASGSSLYLANADGTGSRKLAGLPNPFSGFPGGRTSLAWSPTGQEIALTLVDPKTRVVQLWGLSADGTGLHRMFPGWHERDGECCGSWMPDGKYFVFQSQDQIWAARQAGSFLRKASRKPVQLTSGAVSYRYPVPGKDGKRIFAVAGLRRGELQRYNTRAKAFEPFLGGISAEDVSFSEDGKWAAYTTFPEGIIWRSKLDGSDRLQLSSSPLFSTLPRWSPDGKVIVFDASQPDKGRRIYLVPSGGGTPEDLTPNHAGAQGDPGWSPDGKSLVFGARGQGPRTIQVVDVKTREVSLIPGSGGLFSPRWSPDGRYLVAMPTDSSSLMLFDFKTQKWSMLFNGIAAYPNWSHDGRFVYFLPSSSGSVGRISVPGGKFELVVSMKGLPNTGFNGDWLGLTPDDEPLVLKDAGTEEVVSMDFHEP
ncbi:MAG TPA: hypothetical protein VNM47_12005, partial [Terriglobia bacterium]|nr:hypothetical protein [Terriglobia bacterium]